MDIQLWVPYVAWFYLYLESEKFKPLMANLFESSNLLLVI